MSIRSIENIRNMVIKRETLGLKGIPIRNIGEEDINNPIGENSIEEENFKLGLTDLIIIVRKERQLADVGYVMKKDTMLMLVLTRDKISLER